MGRGWEDWRLKKTGGVFFIPHFFYLFFFYPFKVGSDLDLFLYFCIGNEQ